MGELQTLFGQLWKEYALSDSRYLTQNAFVLCMESITAVGPICNPFLNYHPTDIFQDMLGSAVFCRGRYDCHPAPSSSSPTGYGVHGSDLR